MGKTLTEHLQKLKDQQQGIFVPYIMAGDHEKAWKVCRKPSNFWRSLVSQPLKLAFLFQIRWQMAL